MRANAKRIQCQTGCDTGSIIAGVVDRRTFRDDVGFDTESYQAPHKPDDLAAGQPRTSGTETPGA